MITPVIINRLQWKAYLIFMCTNAAFIPLVYFCYPETANLSLEEIDYLFTSSEEGAVKMSKRLHRERQARGGRREESVVGESARRRMSGAGRGGDVEGGKGGSLGGGGDGFVEQFEKV